MKTLFICHLTELHQPTGYTRHYSGGVRVGKPVVLEIRQYVGDIGFYLIHLDELGQELTDTYHETLDSAFVQAEKEFGITKNEFTSV